MRRSTQKGLSSRSTSGTLVRCRSFHVNARLAALVSSIFATQSLSGLIARDGFPHEGGSNSVTTVPTDLPHEKLLVGANRNEKNRTIFGGITEPLLGVTEPLLLASTFELGVGNSRRRNLSEAGWHYYKEENHIASTREVEREGETQRERERERERSEEKQPGWGPCCLPCALRVQPTRAGALRRPNTTALRTPR